MGPAEIIIRGHLTAQTIARTWQIAMRLRCSTAQARSILLKLEKRGLVRRSERYSAVNDTCWVLAPAETLTPAADDAGVGVAAATAYGSEPAKPNGTNQIPQPPPPTAESEAAE